MTFLGTEFFRKPVDFVEEAFHATTRIALRTGCVRDCKTGWTFRAHKWPTAEA